MRLRTSLTAGGVVIAGLTSAAFAATAQATAPTFATAASVTRAPVFDGACGSVQYRPGSIGLSGDGSAFLAGFGVKAAYGQHVPTMKWSHWGTQSASTLAEEWTDTDQPSVGHGTLYGSDAYVKLYRPVDGVFTRMYVDARLQSINSRYHTHYPLKQTLVASHCSGGGWSW